MVGRRPTDADLRGEHRCRHPAVGAEQVDHPRSTSSSSIIEMIVSVCVILPSDHLDFARIDESNGGTWGNPGAWDRPSHAQRISEPPPAYQARRDETRRARGRRRRAAGRRSTTPTSNTGCGRRCPTRSVRCGIGTRRAGVLAARDLLDLPTDHVPQLIDVDAWLRPLTGFGYRAVDGILPGGEFFRALADRTFASTQYVRWEGSPLYTPEPDVIHEVMGHGNCLACPEIADLHRLAGAAIGRLEGERSRAIHRRRVLVHRRVRRGDRARRSEGVRHRPAQLAGRTRLVRRPRRNPTDRHRGDGARSTTTSTTTNRCCSPASRSPTCSTWSAASSPTPPTTRSTASSPADHRLPRRSCSCLDRLEQRLEVALAEPGRPAALDDLDEHGRAVGDRFGEQLQQIPVGSRSRRGCPVPRCRPTARGGN